MKNHHQDKELEDLFAGEALASRTLPKDVPLERVREHWKRAADYPADKEKIYSGHTEAHGFELARGRTVLEYGCGGGSDTMSFLRHGARTVFYADIVASNVDATAKRIREAGDLDETKAIGIPLSESASIPMPPARVDIVSSHGVLHHIVDPEPVLREFHRVLRPPSGRLFVMLYTEQLERKFERRIAELMSRVQIDRAEAFAWCTDEEGAPYARSYTVKQGTDLLESCGFKVQATHDYNAGDFRTFQAVRT